MSLNKEAVLNIAEFDAALQTASMPLPIFREALAHGRQVLREHHLKHRDAALTVHTHAWLVDQLLVRAWNIGQDLLQDERRLALVAVGGYGRGELHPASDVDLMILLKNGHDSSISKFVENLVQFLWDIGLEVGHSTRSLKDCIQAAKNDITVATNLMESRLLTGDAELFESMVETTSSSKIWPSRRFFNAKLKEQLERHHRFGDTAYNLEPNIKEGPGGLRDIQMILWIGQKHFRLKSLDDLTKNGLLSSKEHRSLIKGRNYLWLIRNSLHYLAKRREDRLLFDHQRILAKQFGYTDRQGKLAVEQFMKHYYRTIKELSLLNEILLQHFKETIQTPGKMARKSVHGKFYVYNGYLEAKNDTLFERHPQAMLEIFLTLQKNPDLKGVRAHTIRLLRENLHRIDTGFRKDPANKALFMEIIRQPRGITHELRRMNAYGVLGAYIPAFGRIVGQMQHDLFHVYTVDEHILFVVRNLRRFTVPQYGHEFPLASSIIKNLAKPERLYIAGLFHDVAKGRRGDHSILGESEARKFCKQHGLNDYDTDFVTWLVRDHLTMSWTAQRQDISDPSVIVEFARSIGDQEHLDNLYLLTVADIRGTSPQVWNDWKGHLLTQLYIETSRVFLHGLDKEIDLEDHAIRRRNGALEILGVKQRHLKLTQQYWQQMETDYFLHYDTDALAWHAKAITGSSAADFPLASTRFNAQAGGTEFLIYTPSKSDLFVILTRAFERLNLSIVDARVNTTRHGFALHTYVVLDCAGKPINDKKTLAHLESTLREALLQPGAPSPSQGTYVSRQLKHFPIETKVNFTNAGNSRLTIMEVTAQDRPGLLHQVALALNACKVKLEAARISTFGERAEDVFFVVDRDNMPLTNEQQKNCLAKEIVTRLQMQETESVKKATVQEIAI